MARIQWTESKRSLGELLPWSDNPRQIRGKQAERLLESVEEFGQVETLAIGPANELYNGHQRLKVLMQKHGPRYVVDVRVASRALTERERQKLTVYLHKGAAGEWDFDALANTFDTDDLLAWGFEAAELGLGDAPAEVKDAEAQIDRAEELRQKWGVETGQLWQLGEHRLICGDCTDAVVVARVMDGERAQILFTSPPYWVGFEYEQEDKWSEVLAFIDKFAALYVDYVQDDGRIIINTGTVQAGQLTDQRAHMRMLIDSWAQAFERNGWLMRYVRFWVKDGGLLHTAPQSDCIDQHTEFLGYFYNPQAKFRGQERTGQPWAGKGYWSDIPGAARQSGHIAAFPVDLPSRNVQLFSREGESVLEPFCGSGTTVIAAENLKRRCFAIEISPAYVAVALQRFCDATGKTPVLISEILNA